ESVFAHQIAADEEIEELIGAAHLDVAFQRDRVVALRERKEQLVNGDRLLRRETFAKIVALENPRECVLRSETNHPFRSERAEPFGVEAHFGLDRIEDLEDLL